jgi:chromosome segregation ATPase
MNGDRAEAERQILELENQIRELEGRLVTADRNLCRVEDQLQAEAETRSAAEADCYKLAEEANAADDRVAHYRAVAVAAAHLCRTMRKQHGVNHAALLAQLEFVYLSARAAGYLTDDELAGQDSRSRITP